MDTALCGFHHDEREPGHKFANDCSPMFWQHYGQREATLQQVCAEKMCLILYSVLVLSYVENAAVLCMFTCINVKYETNYFIYYFGLHCPYSSCSLCDNGKIEVPCFFQVSSLMLRCVAFCCHRNSNPFLVLHVTVHVFTHLCNVLQKQVTLWHILVHFQGCLAYYNAGNHDMLWSTVP